MPCLQHSGDASVGSIDEVPAKQAKASSSGPKFAWKAANSAAQREAPVAKKAKTEQAAAAAGAKVAAKPKKVLSLRERVARMK